MSKLKLNDQQLTRLNRAYYETELAGIKLKELMAEKQRVFEEIQKETGSNFQTWNAGTGETDTPVESTAVEILPPPRKRKK
jgi:hypothetical protein